jgi:hypothetical protein
MAVAKIASIIAKKRAADIAKKKIAKVSTKEARKVAVESQKIKAGGTRPLMRPKGMGNITTRPSNFPKKTTVKSIPKRSPEQTSKDRAIGKSLQREDFWTGMKTPPKVKPKPTNVLHNRPRTLRQENAIGRQVNKFIKKQARLRQEVERQSFSIGKKAPEPRIPNRSMFEREFNLKPGQEKELRARQAMDQLREQTRLQRIAIAQFKRDTRENIIGTNVSRKGPDLTFTNNPNKVTRLTAPPSKTMGTANQRKIQGESDRNAINAVREAERNTAITRSRKIGTGGGRPARKSRGN